MTALTDATWRAAIIGRWTARILGTLLALVFLAFVFGEGPPPVWRLSFRENAEFFAMCALAAGLVVAWKWEGWGAALSLAGYAALFVIERRFALTLQILLPAAVAALHVLCWSLLTSAASQKQ